MALPNSKRQNFRNQEIAVASVDFHPMRGDTSTVTQTTNRSTGVTINSLVGQITTDATALAAGAEAKFVVTNSYVTQTTNRSTGVTINSLVGQITTDATALAAGAEAKFVVTNSYVSAKDVIVINAASGQTADTSIPTVIAVADGSFTIQLTNLHAATADTGAMVINFIVLGGN